MKRMFFLLLASILLVSCVFKDSKELKLARSAGKSGNYKEALNYYDNYISDNSDDKSVKKIYLERAEVYY
ncbi:MAG TPA: hypothetical protein PK899_11275, partial [Spirochaetota bacterium]|nr:hypothetical protein [Spirochaetota bacterium]